MLPEQNCYDLLEADQNDNVTLVQNNLPDEFSLKYFFSEGITNDSGEEVSNKEVKKILGDAIGNESKKKPLTDEALMELLKDNRTSRMQKVNYPVY